MASSALRLPHAQRLTTWFSEFLRSELAPYPGRGSIVARMVISSTLSAMLIVTFGIPGGAIGALVAFILSRENLLSTARSALSLVVAFSIGGLFIPIGARFFAGVPEMHFVWEAVSLFAVFFLLRTLTNFVLVSGLSLVATNILGIWYLPGPASRNVELTLWQVAAALIGALVTLAVEVVFHAISHADEVMDGIDVRLKQIEILMRSYAADEPPSTESRHKLGQYAVVGMGALRRHLARSNEGNTYRSRMSAFTSLTGRAVDFSAALSTSVSTLEPDDRARAAWLAKDIAALRASFTAKSKPAVPDRQPAPTARTPLLSELEQVVLLMPTVFSSESTIDPRLELLETPPSQAPIFVEDAFTNREYINFALAGTLAAMICYVIYVSLAWPGLATSVTTCVLTALSNVGASRQKQVLRLGGALLGGFVLGMGSQIFVLPYIDSITGFTVLMAAVSALAAWVSTSSSRLSYAGLQIALAFYLVNLSDFTIQTSLSVARDRVVGVLLGVSMMWLVFEKAYPRPAADEMVRIFVTNLRKMAELVRISNSGVDAATVLKIRRQRDLIYRQFGLVNAQADAVPFETGPGRPGHMAARDRIRRWQASLRTFYLLEAPLIQFRIFGDPHQHDRPFAHLQDSFRERCADAFDHMALCLENQLKGKSYDHLTHPSVVELLETAGAPLKADFSERELAMLNMSKTLGAIVDRMQQEVAADALYATGS
ncbi:hypothetical protein [Silvibacterium acidisoli]|uniref:hypothetical protein n=1 Tax=Acidobacteriaceae bacterium ZG23-2 TaxID=2883246 RepID=UPI00406C07BF